MKQDMSNKCGFGYDMRWRETERLAKCYRKGCATIEDLDEMNKAFTEWYNEHCAKCTYMCEVCMYGEEVK